MIGKDTESNTSNDEGGQLDAIVIRADSFDKKHDDCKRCFTQLSKAWYAEANLKNSKYKDEVNIGFYDSEGGTTGEFTIRWQEINRELVPELSAFDDSWNALFNFGDLLKAMSDIDDKNISPDEFCKILESLGIENITKTEYV